MRQRSYSLVMLAGTLVVFATGVVSRSNSASAQTAAQWTIHDRSRAMSPVITPGEPSTQDRAGAPPSDSVVLFNGKDLSNWEAIKGGEAKWKVGEGFFEVAPGTGDIQTRDSYGDCQLHVEWATPDPPRGQDQDRGNSGVFLHGLYEIQVLDSFGSKTYADGQAAAVYGEFPPLVNACRAPGRWQTYDIVFHGARFDRAGVLLRRATVTVIQNGVLVQDHVKIMGPTAHMHRPAYEATPEKLPLRLQDHNHPVRYRNLWIRVIPEEQP